MLRTIPHILFDANCADAMSFYHQCIGGNLVITRLGDTPMKDQFAAEKHNRIINAHLSNGNIAFSAADWMASPELKPLRGNMFNLFIIGEGYTELKEVFDKLSQGASKQHFQPLHDMPFGVYGQLTDKYGVQWIFKADKKV